MNATRSAQVSDASVRHRRRRIIPVIDASFQWKYTLIITALGVGITAIMGGFLYKAHVENTRIMDLGGHTELHEQVVRGDQIFLLYLIISVLVVGVCLAFWGLVVTHRISGPLYILERYLRVLADGRYPDLRPLRKSDELRDFFASFEEAIATLRSQDQRAYHDARAALESLTKEGGDPQAGLGDAKRALERSARLLAERLGEAEEP